MKKKILLSTGGVILLIVVFVATFAPSNVKGAVTGPATLFKVTLYKSSHLQLYAPLLLNVENLSGDADTMDFGNVDLSQADRGYQYYVVKILAIGVTGGSIGQSMVFDFPTTSSDYFIDVPNQEQRGVGILKREGDVMFAYGYNMVRYDLSILGYDSSGTFNTKNTVPYAISYPEVSVPLPLGQGLVGGSYYDNVDMGKKFTSYNATSVPGVENYKAKIFVMAVLGDGRRDPINGKSSSDIVSTLKPGFYTGKFTILTAYN